MAKQKRKRKAKQGIQVGLFDQEMFKPVDIREAPPVEITEQTVEIQGKQVKISEAHMHRPHIVLGSTKSCLVCGELITTSPAGGVKCSKCWWFQLLNE